MLASDASPATGLYRIAACGAVILGSLLAAGAIGHTTAVWERLASPTDSRLALLMPAFSLAAAAAINLLLITALWRARRWAGYVGLVSNGLAAGYVAFLLTAGIDDHPIGAFLAALGAQTVVHLAICVGLTWPHQVAGER